MRSKHQGRSERAASPSAHHQKARVSGQVGNPLLQLVLRKLTALYVASEDDALIEVTPTQIVGNRASDEDTAAGLSVYSSDVHPDLVVTLGWNNLYDNDGTAYSWPDGEDDPDRTGQDGNLAVDPTHAGATTAQARAWDLTLQEGSPAIDAGRPDRTDADGSPADLGAYGGNSAW